ncbi:MAG: endopeptidase La [Deltaproteobacteria bacterium]|nr:endopeptidase La [Deltaproteobacteria bacterium]
MRRLFSPSSDSAAASESPERVIDFRVPESLPAALPVLPLRQGVVLPGGIGPLSIGRPGSIAAAEAVGVHDPADPHSGLILVAVQREPADRPLPSDLLPVAVLARVLDAGRPRGRAPFVVVAGMSRVRLDHIYQDGPTLMAEYTAGEVKWDASDAAAEGLLRAVRAQVETLSAAVPEDMRIKGLLKLGLPPHLWLDAVASAIGGPHQWRRDLLMTANPKHRAEQLALHVASRAEVIAAERAVKERISSETQSHRKEVILRQQLKAIQDELGEGDAQVGDLEDRLRALPLPPDVRKVVDREVARLARVREGSPERAVAVDWLEWIASLPWGVETAAASAELVSLEAALDRSHYGLEDVKKQVVEHLAVRQLAGSGRADVLLLVGPPGVGKTSIGQAIAEATGRELVRIALGGVRDEAEIRGHRRTYVGARPGRLVEGIRRAGAQDPVVLLDEIDKLGAGFQGDPAAALLELLDPEQNHAFTDRYLEVPLDMSKVLFIATANDLGRVPGPLRDRMEVLRIDGYTVAEKVRIVRAHLLETLAANAGVTVDDVSFTDEAIEAAITGWTREAGVRGLQRTLGKVYRAAAVKKARGTLDEPLQVGVDTLSEYLGRQKFHAERRDEGPPLPGIATGLAWTPVGGDVLMVEAAALPGTGRLVLTGQLGDVMKESARAALTYVLSHAERLEIDVEDAQRKDIHIHVPAGAVPKDGPSAGVTMFTALASLLSNRPVRASVAMTGEASLRGRVLPVGGIKSKVLAAHRQGIRTIVLPRRNEHDLEDVPQQARDELTFVLVDHMDEVLEAALDAATPVGSAPANGHHAAEEGVA